MAACAGYTDSLNILFDAICFEMSVSNDTAKTRNKHHLLYAVPQAKKEYIAESVRCESAQRHRLGLCRFVGSRQSYAENHYRSYPSERYRLACSEMATQLPIIFRENDSLDDFLDRMLICASEQAKKQTAVTVKPQGSFGLTEFRSINVSQAPAAN